MKLLLTITFSPDVLSQNAVNKLVLYGKPVMGSELGATFKAAFMANTEANLPNNDSFLGKLCRLYMSKYALLLRHFVYAFATTFKRLPESPAFDQTKKL